MKQCPCGGPQYKKCCGIYLEGTQKPSLPEALMRSRYTAYSLANCGYIKRTMRDKALMGFDENNAERWAKKVHWVGLTILNASEVKEECGIVEFIAQYIENDQLKSIHERSEFHRIEGDWFYVDGVQIPTKTVSISRNMLCPCGSKRKFKNCKHNQDTALQD